MSIEAFGDLLVSNLEAKRRFVRRRMGAQDYAEDGVQQTLLLAFAHRHQLREPSKFKSWICSIAVSEIRIFLRSTRKSLSLDELPTLAISDVRNSPFVCCEERERKTRLRAALRRLHDRDRVILQFDLGAPFPRRRWPWKFRYPPPNRPVFAAVGASPNPFATKPLNSL